jgi:hypothetical protein
MRIPVVVKPARQLAPIYSGIHAKTKNQVQRYTDFGSQVFLLGA